MEFLKVFASYYVSSHFFFTTLLIGFCATFAYRRSAGWPVNAIRIGLLLLLVGNLAQWSVYAYMMGQITSTELSATEYSEKINSYQQLLSVFFNVGILMFIIGALSSNTKENRLISLAGALFDPRGKQSRGEFASIVLPILISNLLGVFFLTIVRLEASSVTPQFWGFLSSVILFSYILFVCYIKRFRDLGHSGLMVLIMLIPLVGIVALFYLLLAKGEAVELSEPPPAHGLASG